MFPDNQQQDEGTRYRGRGYSEAEVEILLRLGRLESEIAQIREASGKYVRREEFDPVQRLVYGMVGVILLAFLGAIVALVITK